MGRVNPMLVTQPKLAKEGRSSVRLVKSCQYCRAVENC